MSVKGLPQITHTTHSEDDLRANREVFGDHSSSVEKDLMVNVILQAKADLFETKGKHVQEVLEWFNETNVRDSTGRPWLYSFESICEQLDLDVDSIRRGILTRYEEL